METTKIGNGLFDWVDEGQKKELVWRAIDMKKNWLWFEEIRSIIWDIIEDDIPPVIE